ncbi:hypothetical protein ACFL0D_03225 [Thermoproteota archaeon]
MCKHRKQTSVGEGWKGDKETEQVSAGMGDGRDREIGEAGYGREKRSPRG